MDTLYAILLPLHNILRWLVLLFGLFAIIRALTGMRFRRPWEAMDDRAGLLYTIFIDTQVLVGLILYVFLSPATRPLFSGQGMGNAITRYFGAEHVFLMVVGLVLAHVGRSLSRRAAKRASKITEKVERDRARLASHRSAAIFYTLSLVSILLGIPWPFLAGVGRPLIRFTP